MTQATPRAAFFCALAVSAIVSSGGLAQTSASRTSSFGYDAASGLLNQEVIEPNQSAFRLQTDYVLDAFGNKVQVTVSGVDIVTRSETVTYDTRGQFRTSATNALNQSETWPSYDQRFGAALSHTGPNGLTTTWSYDVFGRKTLEVRADGTQTKWDYLFCSGFNGGTASCPSGAVYLIKATPLASDGTTQNGPIGTVYFDQLDREIARDTQGFDAGTIRAATQYDALNRVLKKSRPYFASGGTPQWTTFTYDVLGRVVTETLPDNSTMTHAYHGLVTSDTNGLNQTRTVTKNSQGNVVSVTDAANSTTSYLYDPFGNLIRTIDPMGNMVTATYDVRGRKIASNDPNLGPSTYGYNVLGHLVSQTDAKGQTTTASYDKLGRPVQRVEPDMTSVFVYDTASHGIGKLASASITAGIDTGYQRVYSYDSLGRPQQLATTMDGTTYNIAAGYDANGRMSSVTYPSGFSVTYLYTSLGYTQQLRNTLSGQVYWTANARDAEQHLTEQTAGNGVVTSQAYSATTGRLSSILAGTGSGYGVQNFTYTYDVLGNLLTRGDINTSLSESFVYDTLNRLTSATVGVSAAKTFGYNAIGNLTAKSDVGTYTYPPAGQPFPHAVMSISGSTINTTFSYDPNGNQTAGLGRTVTYTSYNKPSSITQGARTITFNHAVDHQRFKQVTPEGTTRYFDAFDVHVELFTNGTNQWNEYLSVGGRMIGVRYLHSDETVTTRYFHLDHLGSISVITNESGAVVERLSYDAWGKRRFPDGSDDPTGSITSQTVWGFTGQEQLTGVGLVHLNGRVYDPLIGRMMSADPVVPDPLNGQTWNRYSYVINNPLAFTDPSGYCFLGLCGIGKAISNFFSSIGKWFTNQIGSIASAIVASVACSVSGPAYAICVGVVTGVISGVITGVTTGSLELALKAGVIAGVTAAAFTVVGDITTSIARVDAVAARAFNVAGHAAVGCGSAVASGEKCGPSALAGAITSFAGPIINTENRVASFVANVVVGGVAAVAGGGKFENGAFTAAFGYLFNQLKHSGNDPSERHQIGVNAAIEDYKSRGYSIVESGPIAVDVPGSSTPRYYDFLAYDPVAGKTIGVEVKTTLYDSIDLQPDQVAKDVVVMRRGGVVRNYGLVVDGVGYTTYCWGCGLVPNIRGWELQRQLKGAGIHFNHGGWPGDLKP
jgi:RHS repeat-associated protein